MILSLIQQNISGVPIVDPHRFSIVAIISIRDAKHIVTNPECYRVMNKPLGTCLEHFTTPVVCYPASSVLDVLHAMAEKHVYHAYVVKDDMQPIAVMSLRDVIARFVKEPPGFLPPDAL